MSLMSHAACDALQSAPAAGPCCSGHVLICCVLLDKQCRLTSTGALHRAPTRTFRLALHQWVWVFKHLGKPMRHACDVDAQNNSVPTVSFRWHQSHGHAPGMSAASHVLTLAVCSAAQALNIPRLSTHWATMALPGEVSAECCAGLDGLAGLAMRCAVLLADSLFHQSVVMLRGSHQCLMCWHGDDLAGKWPPTLAVRVVHLLRAAI